MLNNDKAFQYAEAVALNHNKDVKKSQKFQEYQKLGCFKINITGKE